MCDVCMYVLYVLVGVGVCSCVGGAHVCESVETKGLSLQSLSNFFCVCETKPSSKIKAKRFG